MRRGGRRLGELACRDAVWLCQAVLELFTQAVAAFAAPGQAALDADRVVASLGTLRQGQAQLSRFAMMLMKRSTDRAAIEAIRTEIAPFLTGEQLAAAKEPPAKELAKATDEQLVTTFLGLAGAAANMLRIVEDFAAWRYRGDRGDMPGLIAEMERTMALLQAACEAGQAQAEAGSLADAHLN